MTNSIIMKNKTFATTFTSFADFAAGCDQPETNDPLMEPGKTETPEARQEAYDNALGQNGGEE
jgi:hypothetical protein